MHNIFTRLWLLLVILFLTSCGGACGSGGSTSTSLSLDQVSTVPLINNQAQSFYVYANNNGNNTLSGIEWSINSESASSSLIAKAKSKLHHLLSNDEVSPIVILDSSECVSVAPGQSCRIKLQANRAGIFQLTATSGGQKITLFGGSGVVPVENYPLINTGDPADTLTMTPLSEISYTDGIGSGSFFVINNGTSNVALDMELLQSGLPANASIVLGECPDPLPGRMVCQVRVVFNNTSGTTDQELTIPINLGGTLINQDGTSGDILPDQNGNSTIHATNKNIGTIQYIFSQSVTIDNSFANVTTATVNSVISNSGSGTLTINSLSPNGNILSIANDTCSGKTLGTGEMCSYSVNLDVTQISNSSNQAITIAYTDEAGSAAKTVTSNIAWTYTAPLPVASSSINLTIGNNNLNQANLTTTLSIQNTGNVALSNITTPTISPANPRVVISDNPNNSCSGTLAVNAVCSYIITYTPTAPSETTSITVGSISASHSDNRGSTTTTNFNNSSGLNLASVFEGLLSSSGTLSLSESVTSGTVSFTNIGDDTATISGVVFNQSSSANLQIASTTCTGVTLDPNQSCTVTVSIVTSVASGSGNGTLVATYNNHNGTTNATSSNSNLSWLIGNAPSLQVVFASSNLTTPITLESVTVVTLTNNGRDDLTDIVIPSLASPLAYSSGSSNGCATNGTQDLAVGESCSLVLTYSPSVAQSTVSESLPSFSASYNDGSVVTYTTNPYSITLTALALGDLSLSPVSVSQSVNWVTNTQTSQVVVTNTGGVPITLSNPTSGNNQITTSGCASGELQPGESCSLSVIGNYNASASNTTINGVITLNYSDFSGAKTEDLNVSATYAAMPVVTPGLSLASPSLFTQNLSIGVNESSSYAISLTNTTSATNNGLESISIPYSSLMPVDGNGATYSINTTGISNNPCSLPSSGNSMVLAESCNYHLVINTGGSVVSSTQHDLSTDYSYNSYNGSSITPSLTPIGSAVTNIFNLAVTVAAKLNIAVETGQDNRFNAIEEGINPNPTIQLNITNAGTGPVNGSVSATLPSGITGSFTSCDNLGVGATCNVTLTMDTTNVIAAANLNTVAVNYNDGNSVTSASMPSISYSVVTPSSPAITMVESVIGCVSGDGTATACMNNPDTMGGNASSMKVRLTFTNTSNTASATSLSLQSTESGLFSTAGYTVNSNTCNSGVAANNGTCVIEYNMPVDAATSAINPDISDSTFMFDYNYTTPQGQNLTGNNSSNLSIDINVVAPVMNIPSIESITVGESSAVTITFSSLYQAGTPSVTLTAIAGLNKPTFSTPSCTAISSHGSSCPFVITTESTTESGIYTFNASSYSGNVTATRNFSVAPPPPLVIFVTLSSYNGNLGGFAGADAKCMSDGNKPPGGATYKALLAGNNATIAGRSYFRTDWLTVIAVATGGNLVGPSPLINPINGGTPSVVWTGTEDSNCNRWRDGTTSRQGYAGLSASSASDWFTAGTSRCNVSLPLYCAAQP